MRLHRWLAIFRLVGFACSVLYEVQHALGFAPLQAYRLPLRRYFGTMLKLFVCTQSTARTNITVRKHTKHTGRCDDANTCVAWLTRAGAAALVGWESKEFAAAEHDKFHLAVTPAPQPQATSLIRCGTSSSRASYTPGNPSWQDRESRREAQHYSPAREGSPRSGGVRACPASEGRAVKVRRAVETPIRAEAATH